MADELVPASPDGPQDPRFDDLPADRLLEDPEEEARDGDAGPAGLQEAVQQEREPEEAPDED